MVIIDVGGEDSSGSSRFRSSGPRGVVHWRFQCLYMLDEWRF